MSEQGATKKIKTNSIVKDIFVSSWIVLKMAWKDYKFETIFSIIVSILIAFSPYLQRAVEALLINSLTSVASGGDTVIPIIYFTVIIPAVLLFNVLIFATFEYFDAKMFRELKLLTELRLAEKLSSLDVAVHEDPKFRDKVTLLNEGGAMWSVPSYFVHIMSNLQNIFGLLIVSFVMYSTSWKILVLIFVASIPRFIVEIKYGQKEWGLWQASSENFRRYNHANQQLQEASSVREVQSYQSTNFFLNEIKSILNKFHIAQLGQDRKQFIWKIFSQLVSVLAIGVVIWKLIGAVMIGSMQIGTFIFVLASVVSFEAVLIGFFMALSRQYKITKIVVTFDEVLNQSRYIQINPNSKQIQFASAPEIVFENVTFVYPSSPDKFILKDFNLKISSGEKLAIVGINGAGKSTFIKLLCRFYEPTSGRITINGVDLKDISLESWYGALALLAQDYQTYKFKVKDIIHLGRIEDAGSDTDIKNSAVQSDADEFIQKWEHAYDQQIGVEFTGGIDPSQGQKQKLALARALFRKAFITILDEPTASVDAKAEKQIFDQLEKVMGSDKTLILISHRFATVRNADKIAVIDGQNIKEIGTHEELLKLGGLYAEMYNAQAEGYKD